MTVRPGTLEFLHELERSSNRKLFFPTEVGYLLEAAREKGNNRLFEEAIFLAKFVTKSSTVMKRIGPDGEGFDKLSAEFESGIQKASSLLKIVCETCPEDVADHLSSMFFSVSHDSIGRLMKLFEDLSLVKNWILDKKPLP